MRPVGVEAGGQNAECRMQNAKCGMRNAEVGGPTDAVSWLAFSVSSIDFLIIMGPLKHASEEAHPYRTDEMHVKNGVFDREKTLVKTR
jgi:hypothetical protein